MLWLKIDLMFTLGWTRDGHNNMPTHPKKKINIKNNSKNRRESNWSTGGAGMSKHRQSGHSGTNRRVLLEKCRDFNKLLEKNKKQAQKMYNSFQELFKNYD